jgi:hypothetical protein
MNTEHASSELGPRRTLWSQYPLTACAGLASLLSLVVLLAAGSGTTEPAELAVNEELESPPMDQENSDEEASGSGTRHKGEEGKMGKPTSKSKSGLYAMKGPKDAIPMEAATRHFLASPYGGSFAVGSDDADVWGGLTGTEIGEAYGVGGLGLVGTGRGGGGTGDGTIGLGSGRRGKDSGYDSGIQSSALTVGTVDDNADPAGYRKALKRLAGSRDLLGLSDSDFQVTAPKHRHDAKPTSLDVALVIDTTGSMGDELEYLKVEVRDIARKISRENPGVDQRWGLVVYRDDGDDYVTESVDFRDINSFVAMLGHHTANGGGDEPEAMDAAMAASNRLSWRDGDATARMVFLVADAPSHSGEPAKKFAREVLKHRADGTAIFPVAGSGVSDPAELQLRMAARATGGQYIFLTDHSGIGGSHAAPKVDEYTVETLHEAMLRMIRSELGKPAKKVTARTEPEPEPTVEPTPEPTPTYKPVDLPRPEPREPFFSSIKVAPDPEVSAAPAPPCPTAWDELQARIAAHFVFAASVAFFMLAGLGLDTLIARRRRLLRAMNER